MGEELRTISPKLLGELRISFGVACHAESHDCQ